jgi:hypothetical protein
MWCSMGEVLAFERQSRFSPEPFSDVCPLAQPWRVKGALPSRGVAFIVGQSKAGKSFLAIDTVLRIAAGAQAVLGRSARRCGVVYVAAEDPNGCRARVAAWRLKYHRTSPTPFELIGQGMNLLDEGDVADLKATLADIAERFEAEGHPLGIVVLDTLSRCIPGVDENSSTDMSRAFGALEEIEKATGALILVVAHFGKAGGDKGIRGWSGFDANSDATITLERDGDDPHLRTLTLAKVKNGIDGGKLSFRLESVGLGIFDEDGDEITSCIPAFEAASDAAHRPRKKRALSPPEEIVLASIKHVTDHGRTHPIPASALGAKPWMKAVTRGDVRDRSMVSGFATDGDKPNTVNQRFGRALQGVVARGSARAEGEFLWLL